MKIMKRIFAFATLALFLPCLLTFSVGNDGGLTIWNLIGAIYSVAIYDYYRDIVPRWVILYLIRFVRL